MSELPPNLYLPEKTVTQLSQQNLVPFGASSHSNVVKGQLDQKLIAVKQVRLRHGLPSYPCKSELERACIEWRRAASHRNVQPLFGLWKHNGLFPMLVTPCIEWNIMDYLLAKPTADKYILVFYVGLALEYMHRQVPPILHGNIKGSNILVDQNGKVYLSGIGVYNALATPEQVDYETRWKAPEKVIRGALHSTACDVWSFAMTILEIWTQRHPFYYLLPAATVVLGLTQGHIPQQPSRAVMPDDNLWRMLTQCWSYTPSERLSMTDVLAWLRLLKELSRTPARALALVPNG